MIHTGEIRLIKYGIIPTLPYFEVTVGRMVAGQENLRVKSIVREPVNDKFEYHIQCVKVNAKDNSEGPAFIWKTYYKEPDEVQFFVPDEAHNYIKL